MLFRSDLRLLMVGAVRILNKAVFEEPHKRKSSAAAPSGSALSRIVDLTGADTTLHAAGNLAELVDLRGAVARLTGTTLAEIPAVLLGATDIANRALLVHTGWHGSSGWPRLSEGAASYLRDASVRLVGLDVPIPGEAKAIFSAAGIAVLESLAGLGALPVDGFRVFAVPCRGDLAVRAFACIDPAT